MQRMNKHTRIGVQYAPGVQMTPQAIVQALGAAEQALTGGTSLVMDFDAQGQPVDAHEEEPALTLTLSVVWVPDGRDD